MNDTTRIQWINIAKGICMISFLAGHMGITAINAVVLSYHLSVFFLLSGYTLENNLSTEALNKRFRALMVPYFVTCAAVTVMDVINRMLLHGQTDLITVTGVIAKDLARSFMASGSVTNFGTIEIGAPIGSIWFLPALFFAVGFVQLLLKYIPKTAHRYGVVIAIAMLARISARFIWLPFSIQSGLFAAPLVMLGYDLKDHAWLNRPSRNTVLICIIVFGLGLLTQKTPVSYVTADTSDDILSTACALASGVCVIFLSQKLRSCRPLAWIGRNSILFFCLHTFETNAMHPWFTILLNKSAIPSNSLTGFLVSFFFILAAAGLILLAQKLPRQMPPEDITPQSPRDLGLDAAKAVLIMLMILGHFVIDDGLSSIIYSFHMAAFIFYSGYCFRADTARDLPKALLKEIRRFLVPYALFGIIFILQGHNGLGSEVKRLLFGFSAAGKLFSNISTVGPIYFVLLLLLTKVFYLFIEHFTSSELTKGLCVLALSLFGVHLGKNEYWLPWSADCALYALIFYYLGHCFKKYGIMEYLCKRSYSYFVLCPVWVYTIYTGRMEIYMRNYGSYGLVIIGAVSASILLYMLCHDICKHRSKKLVALLCQIGRSTMYILIVHSRFRSYIGEFVSTLFADGSIGYAVVKICLQVMFGMLLAAVIHQIQKLLHKKTALHA